MVKEKKRNPDENFWKDKKVLITGHTGFKGSWLSLWLNKLEAKVVGYGLEPDNDQSLFNQLNLRDKCANNIENIFISAPENVAWLLNLRGKDNPNSPIPNCKLILTKNKKIFFFSCQKKVSNMKKNKIYKRLSFHEYQN